MLSIPQQCHQHDSHCFLQDRRYTYLFTDLKTFAGFSKNLQYLLHKYSAYLIIFIKISRCLSFGTLNSKSTCSGHGYVADGLKSM